MAKKGQKFRKWSKEKKLEIAEKHLKEHVSVKQLEKEYKVDHSMISHWVKVYVEEGEKAFDSKRKGNPYAGLNTKKPLTEVQRLELIIAKQEVEIMRLKKGYAAKGAGAKKEFIISNDANTKSLKN